MMVIKMKEKRDFHMVDKGTTEFSSNICIKYSVNYETYESPTSYCDNSPRCIINKRYNKKQYNTMWKYYTKLSNLLNEMGLKKGFNVTFYGGEEHNINEDFIFNKFKEHGFELVAGESYNGSFVLSHEFGECWHCFISVDGVSHSYRIHDDDDYAMGVDIEIHNLLHELFKIRGWL